MHVIDWIILVVYFVGTAAVGLLFMRRAGKSTKDFFVSGRNLPWWIAGTSMVATSFASDTPLLITGYVRREGISRNWQWWCFAIGGLFAVFFMSRLWRRSEVITDVEFTELRYSGKSAAILRGFRGVYLAFFINTIVMAWVILGMMKFFDVLWADASQGAGSGTIQTIAGLFDWDIRTTKRVLALAFACAITVVYSAFSGLWGVVVTDMIQFAIAMFGAIALAVICVGVNGGPTSLREAAIHSCATANLKESLIRFFPKFPSDVSILSKAFWTPAVTGFFTFIGVLWWANKNSDGGSAIIQRMLACRSEKDSLLASLWFNIANYALRTWPWIIVALASIAAYPELSALPEKYRGMDDESVYVVMFMELLPVGLLGLMVASFFAAFMSTISTHINLGSAYFVNDIYKRFYVKHAEEKHYVSVARIASVAFMLISAGVAWQAKNISSIFEFMLTFSSGIGVVYILRWFWWRVNAWTEIAAMATSSAVSNLLWIVPAIVVWVHRSKPAALTELTSAHKLLITAAVSLVVSLAVTFLTHPVAEDRLMEFYRRIRPPGFWGPIAAKVNLPPGAKPPYRRDIANWIAGVALIFGSMFGIGKLCLGFWASGVVYLIIGAVGAFVIWWNLSTPQSTSVAAEQS